jgi:hypothetical protein
MVPKEAFKSGVLDPIKHERFVRMIDRYAARAGVAPKFLWTAAKPLLKDEEVKYLQRVNHVFNENGTTGLFYVGDGQNPHFTIVKRFSAMVGALVRCFADARLMTVQDVCDIVWDGGQPDARVLFIPNLLGNEMRKTTARKGEAMSDTLCWRAARGKQTVVHVDNPGRMKAVLGSAAEQVIKSMIRVEF